MCLGCFKLEHFEATHVLTSAMPDLYPLPRDSKNLPESSPFVLMLQKMVTCSENISFSYIVNRVSDLSLIVSFPLY